MQLVFGPPGTGKTTFLLDTVDQLLTSGMAPERIAFCSFSRQSVAEASARACAKFNLHPDALPWFRTIHSCAFHLLNLTRGDVIQPEQLAEWARRTSLPIGTTHVGDPFAAALGDRCLQLYHLARARGVSLREEWHRARLPDTPWATVAFAAETYDTYKQTHGLVDFSDMLERAGGTLPVDALIVDESQDSSRAQWSFLRRVSGAVPRIVLAGDDDQAIYGWSGADATQLSRLEGERIVLPQSYRLPRRIKALAEQVVRRITVREPKTWAARDEEGAIDVIAHPERLPLRDGATWLLLARTNGQLSA
ncbi:MAG TPA: ATP-dependent helicase, partial [Gemmatimonadales bacterium]|nr:ATP-dependent helicase [Gemmatimonadales bacterium]